MKKITGIFSNQDRHWVGDGFPVRSLFSYNGYGQAISPFLLLDFAGPHDFSPSTARRGVGAHPHRGFETVTLVYDGEVAHRDSTGEGGVIRAGDVQWMTAASGIIHEEFHSPDFAARGGPFRMVQLWVNLPARDKSAAAGYQSIASADIPTVALAGGAGSARVIAGALDGVRGPARTFTPIDLWDLRLNAGKPATLTVRDGHTTMLVVVQGRVTINGAAQAGEAEFVLFERDGDLLSIEASEDAIVLLLAGAPIDEPIAGYGPFVMNSEAEIREAIADYNSGRFGKLAA